MKLLLVNPVDMNLNAPLGLASLAAYLRRSHEVRIVSLYRDFEPPGSDKLPFRFASTYFGSPLEFDVYPMNAIQRAVEEEGFRTIGFTAMTYQAEFVYRLAAFLKERYPGITIIMGGVHATFCHEEALDSGSIDFVVCGEGEASMESLLRHLEGGDDALEAVEGIAYLGPDGRLQRNEPGAFLDIDALPPPARDLIPLREGDGNPALARASRRILYQMNFSRGCPADCVFCCSPKMFKRRIRIRKVADIVAEISDVKERYGGDYFGFEDEVFAVSRKHLMEFLEHVGPLKINWTCQLRVDFVEVKLLKVLKATGCRAVSYGIESGSQRILDSDNKKIRIDQVRNAFRLHRKIGLPAVALVIVGHPHERPEDLQATYDLLREIKPVYSSVQLMVPYPGTRLYDEVAEATGTITSRHWLDYVAVREPIYIPRDLNREIMLEYFQKIINLNYGSRALWIRFSNFVRTVPRNIRDLRRIVSDFREMIRPYGEEHSAG
jgi:radical SAM superfamily enzyme YgiQ (UPF0313 family)